MAGVAAIAAAGAQLRTARISTPQLRAAQAEVPGLVAVP